MAHQGWYFFPILLLEGISLHKDGSAGSSAGTRFSVAGSRSASSPSDSQDSLPGVPRPSAGESIGVPRCAVGRFGLYMGSAFAPNHGMPLVSPKLKLDFLRRQVLISRNFSGGLLISGFMGGLNYQIEHHLFPSMARPYLRKAQPLVAAYCAAQGVHPHHALAVLPRHHQLPEHRRTPRQRPLPLPSGRSTPRPLAKAPHPSGRRRMASPSPAWPSGGFGHSASG